MPGTFAKFNNAPPEWSNGDFKPAGGTLEHWQENLAFFKAFFTERFPYALEDYQNHFSYSGNYNLTLNFDKDSHGKVVLHDNEMSVPYQYAGQYFQEVPMKVKAVTDEGYYFVRWKETGDTLAQIDFSSKVDTLLTPIFLENGISPMEGRPFYKVFPNPVSDNLYLRYGDLSNNEITVRVYNVLGQEIYRSSLVSNEAILEYFIYVGAWVRGVYFVRTNIGGEMFSSKVLVGER